MTAAQVKKEHISRQCTLAFPETSACILNRVAFTCITFTSSALSNVAPIHLQGGSLNEHRCTTQGWEA